MHPKYRYIPSIELSRALTYERFKDEKRYDSRQFANRGFANCPARYKINIGRGFIRYPAFDIIAYCSTQAGKIRKYALH